MRRQAGAQGGDEVSETLYPIQFVQVGPLHDVPAPLVRVITCGRVTLEVVQEVVSTDPPQARYCVVNPPERGKGSSTALNLLKLLVSLPAHAATRDWLSEHLPHNRLRRSKTEQKEDEDIEGGMERVDNVVTLLRKMLCPPQIEGSNVLRPVLVALLKNHKDSGPGYQLASVPLLWLDVDEIASLVQRACQCEQEGQEALSVWEQVYALAARGPYLPLEVYSDWATEKRTEIDGYLKQAVLALHRLYLARDGQASEERVLLLLRTYCRSHPTDEDVLRPLLELLGRRDCVQEAQAYYHRLRTLLEEEGYEPDPRTQRVVKNLRTGQLQHEQTHAHTGKATSPFNATSSLSSQQDEARVLFSHVNSQDIIEAVNTPEETVQQSGTQDMEPSRRNFLQTLSVLGAELFLSPQMQGDYAFVESHSLDFSKASVSNLATITQQFRAMQRRGDVFITSGVHSHLQTIQEALEHTMNDSIRSELWRVLAQTQIVAGFNPIKKTERGRAKTFLEAAIASAQNSGDAFLTGASLGHLAQFSLREEQNLIRAVQLLSRAQEYVQRSHPLNGWFALVMASIAAKGGQKQHCEAYLTEAMTVAHYLPQLPDAADLYFTDFSLTSVHIFTINCWLAIGDAKKAYTHLTKVNLEEVADNRRASAFCDASKACMMVGEFEKAQQFAFQAIDKAASTQQRYVIPRCMTLAQTIQRTVPDAPYAAAITDYARLALQQN